MNILNSAIKSVTVYSDRAIVRRIATVETKNSEYSFVFENLPNQIEKSSIQINSSKDLVLNDIKFEQRYKEIIPENSKNELMQNLQKFESKLNELNDTIIQTVKEKNFVDGIINKSIDTENSSDKNFDINPESWIKLLDFYHTKNTGFDEKIRNINIEKQQIEEKLEAIRFDLKKINKSNSKLNNCVIVKVLSKKEGPKEIQISYMVYGPSWKPIYDLRVDTETKKLQLEYNAIVSQSTNEDWENVKLFLSTAKANVSGVEPQLSPWHISFYLPPPPAVSRSVKRESVKLKKGLGISGSTVDFKSDSKSDFGDDDFEGLMEKPDAEVKTGATSVVFAINGLSSLLSDGEDTKVGILIKNFDADFNYSSVPKLSQFFYLKTKVKNETEFPLLPGKSNIFLDNSFVTNSKMELVAPNEEFWTSLGVDESLKIVYKLINKFEKDEGLFSKKKKVIFEYKIKVNNNKKTDEEILILDQIPISNNEEIVVELIEPKIKNDTESLKIDEFRKISWKYLIKASEEKIFDLKFSVESPRDKIVNGL